MQSPSVSPCCKLTGIGESKLNALACSAEDWLWLTDSWANGNLLCEMDALHRVVIIGTMMTLNSFSSHKEHCLFGKLAMTAWTSLTDTGWKLSNDALTVLLWRCLMCSTLKCCASWSVTDQVHRQSTLVAVISICVSWSWCSIRS